MNTPRVPGGVSERGWVGGQVGVGAGVAMKESEERHEHPLLETARNIRGLATRDVFITKSHTHEQKRTQRNSCQNERKTRAAMRFKKRIKCSILLVGFGTQ